MCPTLEELDGEDWGEPNYPSRLVKTVHRLRKKPIEQFTVEDLRIMINQSFGLEHLVPRALPVLEKNPLAEGIYYPGDLAVAVATADAAFWASNPQLRDRAAAVIRMVLPLMKEHDVVLDDERRRALELFAQG